MSVNLEPVKEPEIHVTIGPTGGTTIEVFHVAGPACQALSRPITDLFETTEVQLKAEHQHEVAKVTVEQAAKL